MEIGPDGQKARWTTNPRLLSFWSVPRFPLGLMLRRRFVFRPCPLDQKADDLGLSRNRRRLSPFQIRSNFLTYYHRVSVWQNTILDFLLTSSLASQTPTHSSQKTRVLSQSSGLNLEFRLCLDTYPCDFLCLTLSILNLKFMCFLRRRKFIRKTGFRPVRQKTHSRFAYAEIRAKWIELTTPGKPPRYKRHFDTKFGQVWLRDSVCGRILVHLLVRFLHFCIFCVPTRTYARPFYRCCCGGMRVFGLWRQHITSSAQKTHQNHHPPYQNYLLLFVAQNSHVPVHRTTQQLQYQMCSTSKSPTPMYYENNIKRYQVPRLMQTWHCISQYTYYVCPSMAGCHTSHAW